MFKWPHILCPASHLRWSLISTCDSLGGLCDLLVSNEVGKAMGVSRFYGKLARSLKHPLWYPVTTALWGAHATWGRHVKASGQSLHWAQPASHSSPGDTWVKTPPDDPSPWPSESSKRKPQTVWSKDKTSLLCPEGSVSVITCLWFHPLSLGAG